MKNFYSFLTCLTLFMLAGIQSNANTVIVKGYVKYANGTPVANHPVTISSDSTASNIACYQVHTTVTNANGYYIDTLSCTNTIYYIKIIVPNCNGTVLVEHVQTAGTTGVIERNFVICNPATTTCVASFTFTKVTGSVNVVSFNSSQSHAGNTTDSIIKRRWRFGNGDTLFGNVVSPTYTYAQPGNYQACLTIVTAMGCEKTVCLYVQIGDTIPKNCQAYFTFSSLASNTKTIKFNSTPSTPSTSPNDQIISRTWRFGNGDSITGNIIEPTYTYSQPGTYIVCLVIKTAKGCVSDICKTIVINNIHCEAKLVFSHLPAAGSVVGFPVKFNSGNSTAAPGDSITERIYKFGDGTVSSGNSLDVTKVYTTMGTYTACLIIRTAKGCSDTACVTVVVPGPNQVYCQAAFTFDPNNTANYKQIKFNSSNSSTSANDQIISRTWKFGDGDSLTGNVVLPVHNYANDGVYTVCLTIRTAGGCVSTFCKVVEIRGPKCKAVLNYVNQPISATVAGYTVKYYSANSSTSQGDSITERIYKFGDGTSSTGNALDVTKVYTSMGTYTACLIIRTAKGCSDTTCVSVVVPATGQIVCKANFSYVPSSTSVKFQSNISTFTPGDSIISRHWTFGDNSKLTGNVKDPIHVYALPGVYNVCLTITTARGCTSSECKQVIATHVNSNCIPQFTSNRIAPKKIEFNSSMSWVPANDTIIERKWEFGDGTTLGGNVISPVKDYTAFGIYTVCLRIKTAKGCDNRVCIPVRVHDSTNITPVNDPIKIVSMYPIPAHTQLTTVVWSKYNNVNATLAVYDIYGVQKWSTTKVLLQGNNITTIPVSNLLAGPYFFRVTTMYGVKGKPFYKL